MSSVSGSSTVNGLYSNPNQISGLVSGLDTESMIEGLVDSYNLKIIGFQQSIVSEQWKQEAYRDVTTDLLALSAKYASFTNQSSNLASNSLFNSATTTKATGSNSDAISVSGTTDSSVYIDSVLQVATAESVVSSALSESGANDMNKIEGDSIDLSGDVEQGLLTGTLSLTYGSSKVSIKFTDEDVLDFSNAATPGEPTEAEMAQALADKINEKLSDATLDGDPANSKIEAYVNAETGEIGFRDLQAQGNSVYISSASSTLTKTLGITPSTTGYKEEATTISMSGVKQSDLVEEVSKTSLVEGASMTITYNGNAVTVTIPDLSKLDENDDDYDKQVATAIADSINEQLEGKFNGAVSASAVQNEDGGWGLSFDIPSVGNNTLEIKSDANELLGLGSGTATSYVSTSDTLGDVLGITWPSNGATVTGNSVVASTLTPLEKDQAYIQAVGSPLYSSVTKEYVDSEGDRVTKLEGGGEDGSDIWVKVDEDDKLRVGQEISINGTVVGVFDEESTIDDVLSAINGSDAGVTASFSSLTNNFVLTATETGSTSQVYIDNTELGNALFGASEVVDETSGELVANEAHDTKDGQDAVVLATVNGEEVTLVRSSNTIDIEGLKVTVKSTFNNEATSEDGYDLTDLDDLAKIRTLVEEGEQISFEQEKDVEPIIEVIKEFVEDYNALMAKIKTYFTEAPLTMSDGSKYKPLTDEDSDSMSESAVASYEEKAKTGLLYGDSNMRSLYDSMSGVFSVTGAFGMDLNDMGFSLAYGTSATDSMLDFDEDKLRDMLENNMETVQKAFTSTLSSNGASGLMETMTNTVSAYASTTGSYKGILIEAAGSEHNSLSLMNNTMQTKIDSFTAMIEKWEEKLSDKVDYYTSQFSKLEVLMSEMNSQSSALADLGA